MWLTATINGVSQGVNNQSSRSCNFYSCLLTGIPISLVDCLSNLGLISFSDSTYVKLLLMMSSIQSQQINYIPQCHSRRWDQHSSILAIYHVNQLHLRILDSVTQSLYSISSKSCRIRLLVKSHAYHVSNVP